MSLFVRNEGPMLFYIKSFKGRKALAKKITTNGGRVCLTRAKADICLAHPETESLSGDFFSTEFITDCVEANALLDIDTYKLDISPPSPMTKQRTIFTSQDHAILRQAMKYTTLSPYGNQLYKDLTSHYPHHTWQSWKDYALKKYLPNIERDNTQSQENANVNNRNESEPSTTNSQGILNERTELLNQTPHISKEELKKDMICEVDKKHIDEYVESYNRICAEYDLWDKDDITKAMSMASGSIQLTKKILDVGFNVHDLDDQTRNLIYTPEEDKAIIQEQGEAYKTFVKRRGQDNVFKRIMFLAKSPLLERN